MRQFYNAYYYRVYCDGGLKSRHGYGGFVVQHAGKILAREKKPFGRLATPAQAEYLSLLLALDWLGVYLPLPSTCFIYSDNQAMIKQLRGEALVKAPALRPLYQEACFRLSRLPGVRLTWVERKIIVSMLGF